MTPAPSVLIVDDETGVRMLMCRWLEAGGYRVDTAGSAEEALKRLALVPSAVALCDIRMPGQDGLWLADRIRQCYPETAVIMATGAPDAGAAAASLQHGAVDYLTKPFGRDRLREAIDRGLEWHRAAWDVRRWRESLEEERDVRHRRLADAIGALHIDGNEALDAMLSMLTLSDRDSYAHAYRVATLARSLAQAIAVPATLVADIEHAALLHDLGKLAMPDAILRKPAPLTAEEHTLVRQHPLIGAALIERIPFLAGAVSLVRAAHERMDGRGYPAGLSGSAVPLGARIIAVADAYDTMTRPRVYREAIEAGEALAELERCRGTQFDPAIVDAFAAVLTRQ
jgi:putative two-component system response regulator